MGKPALCDKSVGLLAGAGGALLALDFDARSRNWSASLMSEWGAWPISRGSPDTEEQALSHAS